MALKPAVVKFGILLGVAAGLVGGVVYVSKHKPVAVPAAPVVKEETTSAPVVKEEASVPAPVVKEVAAPKVKKHVAHVVEKKRKVVHHETSHSASEPKEKSNDAVINDMKRMESL